jgi:hypothetical protein
VTRRCCRQQPPWGDRLTCRDQQGAHSGHQAQLEGAHDDDARAADLQGEGGVACIRLDRS